MSAWEHKEGFDIEDDTVGVYCGECDLEIHDTGRFVMGSENHSIGSYKLSLDEMVQLRDFLTRAIKGKQND